MPKDITGRFAPSPSGRMHMGNAFSCLLAWLSARSSGGRIILRQEDLDPERCKREYADQLEDDLRWLGLDWDQGGRDGGDEYYQSSRRDIYESCLNKLESMGLVYPCFCSRADLHSASAPHASDGSLLYSGACRELSPEQKIERSKSRRPAFRLRVNDTQISFTDGLQGGQMSTLSRDCGDFILRRSDGVHAYQLAVVVDDALMGVSQVVRGRDLLSSTARQIYLQKLLGFETPEYYHIPLLLDAQGRRLSKRDADLDLGAIRNSGASPEAVIGRLAHWAGITDREEAVSAKELISVFNWANIKTEDIFVK